MDCNKAQSLIPELVLETLADEERHTLRRHLEGGCEACNQELDQLTEAASLVADTLEPIAPSPQLKTHLLEQIEAKPQSMTATATLPPRTMAGSMNAATRRSSYFSYVAASLLGLAAGSLFANFATISGEGTHVAQRDNQLKAQWHQRVEQAQQAFGEPRANLIGFDSTMQERQFRAAIFYDGVAKQMHVLVSRVEKPSAGQQSFLWLLDKAGEVLQGFPLQFLKGERAAAIVDLPVLPEISGAVITHEPAGTPSEPQGPVLGRAELRQTT